MIRFWVCLEIERTKCGIKSKRRKCFQSFRSEQVAINGDGESCERNSFGGKNSSSVLEMLS